jgi:hypothetical protein
MLVLTFNKSRSKNYKKALKFARYFEHVECSGTNHISISVKDIFEKWEYFSRLFWLTVDWKDTCIEYNRIKYHSHTDKTMIFYSLQQAYVNWRNCTSYQLVQSYKAYKGDITLDMIESDSLTDEQVNSIIDHYNIKKLQDE